MTWADLEWLRGATDLPILLKGVMTTSDADRAIEAGVDGIYVSNHGGRVLDNSPSTISVLPGIVDAVEGRVDVLVDSGFLRGADVVKALALGARAVLIGKLQVWSLAAGGGTGLASALRLLDAEIAMTMQLMGKAAINDLDRTDLLPATRTSGGVAPELADSLTLG